MSKVQQTKIATMEDVARAVGVTKMTVSYALSGKRKVAPQTREAVLKAAREMNFQPNAHAQGLSSGRSHNTISLYSPHLSLGVDTLKIRCIQRLLQNRNFDVSFHSSGSYNEKTKQDVDRDTMRALRRQRPRAIICATADLQPGAMEELRCFQGEGGLVIYYDHPVEIQCDCVVYDHRYSMYLAAKYLLQLGHRNLGLHVLGPQRAEEPKFVRDSIGGFEAALHEFGGQTRPDWLLRGLSYDNHEEGGAHAARQLLQLEERPTAMCVVNDSAAAAFVVELQRAGMQVPRDLSVIGTDDLPIALYSSVPLTTVSHPVESIAQHVVELLCSRIEGRYDGDVRRINVQGELKVRQSTAPPAQ